MSQLTLEHFERFTKHVDDRFEAQTTHFDDTITAFKAHVDERFDQVDHRLDAIEQMLWQGERLTELERRVRTLAERTGYADLAAPLTRPLAS